MESFKGNILVRKANFRKWIQERLVRSFHFLFSFISVKTFSLKEKIIGYLHETVVIFTSLFELRSYLYFEY